MNYLKLTKSPICLWATITIIDFIDTRKKLLKHFRNSYQTSFFYQNFDPFLRLKTRIKFRLRTLFQTIVNKWSVSTQLNSGNVTLLLIGKINQYNLKIFNFSIPSFIINLVFFHMLFSDVTLLPLMSTVFATNCSMSGMEDSSFTAQSSVVSFGSKLIFMTQYVA